MRVLGEEGFTIRGAHEYLAGSIARQGAMGRHMPDKVALADMELGRRVVRQLGVLDIGQGCVVQGLVLAVEALEGTDRMLGRVGALRQPDRPGGVLVKMAKPGQERRADLPTIGPRTVSGAVAAGLRGIAIEAGATLMTDPAACIAMADEAGLFLTGFAGGDVKTT